MTVLPPKGVCYADGCAVKLTPGRTYCGVHAAQRDHEAKNRRSKYAGLRRWKDKR